MTGGDPVDALPHRVEVERYCVEPLPIRRTRGFSSQCYVESALRNWFSLRRQSTKLQPYRHSGCRSLGALVGGKMEMALKVHSVVGVRTLSIVLFGTTRHMRN